MNIKELCKLCSKYESNVLSLRLEKNLKKDVGDRWSEDSMGTKQINSKITYIERENMMLQNNIERVANVDFNWL